VTDPTPGERAVAAYQIEDVFVTNLNCRVSPEFNPHQAWGQMAFNHRASVDKNMLIQTRSTVDGGEDQTIVRYFVSSEVGLLKAETSVEKKEFSEEDYLASIHITVAADYSCTVAASKDADAISAFSRNAVFHVWPYLREIIHAACDRLRIPRLTIEMFKPDRAGIPHTNGELISPRPRVEVASDK
jgi:hypothetical protein